MFINNFYNNEQMKLPYQYNGIHRDIINISPKMSIVIEKCIGFDYKDCELLVRKNI